MTPTTTPIISPTTSTIPTTILVAQDIFWSWIWRGEWVVSGEKRKPTCTMPRGPAKILKRHIQLKQCTILSFRKRSTRRHIAIATRPWNFDSPPTTTIPSWRSPIHPTPHPCEALLLHMDFDLWRGRLWLGPRATSYKLSIQWPQAKSAEIWSSSIKTFKAYN